MASLPQDESARRQCSTFLIAPDAGFRPRGCRETGGSFDQARCMTRIQGSSLGLLITTELLIMKKLVVPAMALAALALGTLAQVGDAEARRGYRGGGGVAYRGVAVRGPRGG